MTKAQSRQAQNLMSSYARAGLPYEVAIWVVASWMKRQGIAITERNLRRAISRLK